MSILKRIGARLMSGRRDVAPTDGLREEDLSPPVLPDYLDSWLRDLEVPVSLQAEIMRLARAFAAAEHERDSDQTAAALAAEYHALPAAADWGGCLLLEPNGRVLQAGWDPSEPVEPVEIPAFRFYALHGAAEKYPSLLPLLPPRPPDAHECPECGGDGKFKARGTIIATCGKCWGLGWRVAA